MDGGRACSLFFFAAGQGGLHPAHVRVRGVRPGGEALSSGAAKARVSKHTMSEERGGGAAAAAAQGRTRRLRRRREGGDGKGKGRGLGKVGSDRFGRKVGWGEQSE